MVEITPQKAADDFLDSALTHIASRQDAYSESHGRYFQGVATNATPANGAEATADFGVKPDDQAESWSDAGFLLPSDLPVKLELHAYDGPRGKGYTVVISVIVAGIEYRWARATGPEAASRTHDWQEVSDGMDG